MKGRAYTQTIIHFKKCLLYARHWAKGFIFKNILVSQQSLESELLLLPYTVGTE